jgi:hypothetical protein
MPKTSPGAWRVVPAPRLKREYEGRTVRVRHALTNVYGTIAAGTICRITQRHHRGGSRLETLGCASCGVRLSVSKVPDSNYEFVEPVAAT